MRPLLGDPAAVDDDDQVGHPHGREAVRDEERDRHRSPRATARADSAYRSKSTCSACASSADGRLVEDQEQRPLAHHRPAERELLPLAAGQLGAAVRVRRAERRLEAVRQVARRRRAPRRARRAARPHRGRRRSGRSPTPTVSRASSSNAAKSWKPAAIRSRHACGSNGGGPRRRRVIRPPVGS